MPPPEPDRGPTLRVRDLAVLDYDAAHHELRVDVALDAGKHLLLKLTLEQAWRLAADLQATVRE